MKKLIPLIAALVIVAGLFYTGKLNFSKPEITVSDVSNVGKDYNVKFRIDGKGSGIKDLKVVISQNGKDVVVYAANDIKDKTIDLNIPLNPKKLGLLEGKAILKIEAKSNSLVKRTTTYEKQVNIDLNPPVILIIDWTRNIINGGTGFVFFQPSEPLKHGFVKVGSHRFKCLGFNYGYVCPFSYPYFEVGNLPLSLTIEDLAGNQTSQSLPYTLKSINYAKSILNIDDNFIETKIKPLSDRNFSDNVQLFKYVNTEVRAKNEDTIHRITSECKNMEPMFEGYFSYLENSAKLGGFADYRTYKYNGQIIDGADAYHKGFDFASVKNAPVKAANNGVVVFTGFLGIYGNSVVIDHGLCVYSLYSHLDSISVKPGQKVDKNTIIGRTGTTGLAVGDHLHFGLLVNGIEVNPIEWFDQKWLETRFYNSYRQLKNSNR